MDPNLFKIVFVTLIEVTNREFFQHGPSVLGRCCNCQSVCKIPAGCSNRFNQPNYGIPDRKGREKHEINFKIAHEAHAHSKLSFLQYKGPLNLAFDVGCGSGQSTHLLAPHFAKVVGTDLSAAQVGQASQQNKSPNVTFK